MKQLISLPRTVACANCTGRTLLEFDQVDVGLEGGTVIHLSSVPYFQCQECDHRQMLPESQDRLGEGLEALLGEAGALGPEVTVMLQWRELFSFDLAGPGQAGDRSYEVEWLVL